MNEPSRGRDERCAGPGALLDFIVHFSAVAGRFYQGLDAVAGQAQLQPTELIALLHLSLKPSTVSAIAAVSGIRQNGASVMVERLANRQLVTRNQSQRDRRVVEVRITDAGSLILSGLLEDIEMEAQTLLSPLTPAERGLVSAWVRCIAEAKRPRRV